MIEKMARQDAATAKKRGMGGVALGASLSGATLAGGAFANKLRNDAIQNRQSIDRMVRRIAIGMTVAGGASMLASGLDSNRIMNDARRRWDQSGGSYYSDSHHVKDDDPPATKSFKEELNRQKTKAEAQSVYRKFAKTYHPDKIGGSHVDMLHINGHWDIFKNSAKFAKLAFLFDKIARECNFGFIKGAL